MGKRTSFKENNYKFHLKYVREIGNTGLNSVKTAELVR